MTYMLLIVEPADQRNDRTEAEGRVLYDRMLAYGADLQSRGLLLEAQSLASTKQAARLQVRNGERRLVDGPFAEAKEMVGGFFLLDCATRAEALEIAATCPAAEWATIEVREVAPCYK
ncbi:MULTISPECIES: YciI family protein [Paraburkholderia]|uniref:Uncharacterized conserved protein n=1 Tax=Paraburkholderia megapolitana TaxID=420953 RepID=A0A1I3KUF8_9BURK|nr:MULTISPECIES: YciI family protein [Paraburkholderia]MCX4163426.1 YciI family protein [Paraburkholderia megapolitana]MDN7158921.1 YciI family protein [Paraburkholderia sp. CHISQ3]MDQ6495968.1 YciI family protein [Paraburkholderia megapolitana]QDQ80461.1 dehydrogenase [Paraburkholderia megapolitana]SFI76149.1 Uncharacterized conserved protein [Paraburkholderia megapolitana]